MNLTLDSTLKTRLCAQLAQLPSTGYLAVRLSKTGCSGWSFSLQPESSHSPNDTLFEIEGIRFGAHARHLHLLEGMHVTLQKQGLSEVVVFESPLVAHRCGCGTSVQFDKGVALS